jgi:RNA polymerase sigma-70 factor (ECF subfamily)
MDQADSRTMELLQRWHGGDREALDELIERDLPWIQQHVRRRLGPMLRARGETVDYVQDAMIEVLEYGPKFVSASQSRFRAMIARIVENTLRDQHDWFKAKRRAMSREQPLPSDSVLHIDGRHGEITRPSQNAVKAERESYVRLALELLEPDDRKVIMLRQWEEKSFPEIAEELHISTDSARMRFNRALPRLGRKVAELRAGNGQFDDAPTPNRETPDQGVPEQLT